jgi:general secretion pathway protein G
MGQHSGTLVWLRGRLERLRCGALKRWLRRLGGELRHARTRLIELLVVLVILVLLASLVAPRVIGYLGSSRTKAAKVQIQSLSTALEFYKVDTGQYPTTSEGLKALIAAPPGVTSWNGPPPDQERGAQRSVGTTLHLSLARRAGPLRHCIKGGADNQPGGTGENEDVTSW